MEKPVKTSPDSHIVASGDTRLVTFMGIVNGDTFEDDFALVVFYAANLPLEEVKRTNKNGDSALALASMNSANTRLHNHVMAF